MLCLREDVLFQELIFNRSRNAENEFEFLQFFLPTDRCYVMAILEELVNRNRNILQEVFDDSTHKKLIDELERHNLDF
jgi:hypothetical protein